MKIQQSAENYLETIFVLTKRNGIVRSVDIANELGFSKPSVSIAMKSLRENGYIEVMGDGHIALLEKGKIIAEKLYERHTVLTNAIVALGVSEEIAAEDACKIEHIISEETFDAIKKHYNTNIKA
ncbi:MAG: metal-dependent transcriptional regulator [Clostridia bacterium]|nr:metal-dependent transcriptional regulator [Clostridia bacterium]